MHWGQRYRWNKAWGEAVWAEWRRQSYAQGKLAGPPKYAILTITTYAVHLPDWDNAAAACKPIIDALKGYAIQDDAPDKCKIQVELKKVAHRNEEHVEIEIQS